MKRKIIFIIISFLLFTIALSVVFSIWLANSDKLGDRVFDDYFGWKTVANYKRNYKDDTHGNVNYSTKKNGFRRWGNINSTKKKILIVGDSYTQGMQISDGEVYYDYLDNSKFEIFAFGCGGYGTTQEVMIVQNYVDSIKPDLILFQFCHNDLINNQLELETQSVTNNYLMTRPYFINDEIQYKHPNSNWLISKLDNNWSLFRYIHMKYILASINYTGTIEDFKDINKYNKSIETTISVINYLKENTKTPISFFSVSSFGKGYFDIKEICEKSEVIFIQQIHQKVDEAEKKNIKINFAPKDWHWNKKGHEIAGIELNKQIEKVFFNLDSLKNQ